MDEILPHSSSPRPPIPFRKQCRRLNVRGHGHYLTFSCYRRQPFLSKDRSRQWFIEALLRAREVHNFKIWAWVIMPEHIHLLIWPQYQDYAISNILISLKKPVTNAAFRYVAGKSPEFLDRMRDIQPNGQVTRRFWQRGGGYDRNTWSSKEVWEKIHYIHQNPVRRGLVKRPEDWEWSSAQDYLGLRTMPRVPLDRPSLPVEE